MSTIDTAIERDAHSRELIASDTQNSWFVEAGAGSGKTTQLVARLITLLIEEGMPIEKIAAITFNTAAAAELTTRLRRTLDEIYRTGKLEDPQRLDDPSRNRSFTADAATVKERAGRALAGLPGAAIETLHSFSLRLLKQFPLQAELPPTVEKVDDVQAQFATAVRREGALDLLTKLAEGDRDAAERVNKLCSGVNISADNIAEALQLLIDNGMKISDLSDIIAWMDENWGELPEPATAVIVESNPLTNDDFMQLKEHVFIATEPFSPNNVSGEPDKLWAALFLPLRQNMESFAASGVDAALWTFQWPKTGNSGKKDAKAVRDELRLTLDDALERQKSPVVHAMTVLRRFLLAFTLQHAAERARSGKLEYHDMIFLARELVTDEDNPTARNVLSQQFATIFVDEFQDTSPSQLDIVRAIASGSADAPHPGHLFTVGDPKQSIYRFRSADVDSYMQAREQENDERILTMSRNFRSAPQVIEAINGIFSGMFAALKSEMDMEEGDVPRSIAYTPMIAQETPDAPGRTIFLRDVDNLAGRKHNENTEDLEHADIVALVNSALSTQYDDAAQEYFGITRALDYNDIAIIVPTHNIARGIMSALTDAGIPYVSEGSGLLFSDPAIADFLTVVRAIADPADSFTQLAAARTFLLGVSDADLADYAAQQAAVGDEDTAPEQLAQHPVAQARERIAQLGYDFRALPLGEMLRAIAKELRLAEAVAARGDANGLYRLEALFAQADLFGQQTGLGARAFLRYVDGQVEDEHGLTAPILDDGSVGVRIMTIHGSKGREFPFIIVGGRCNKERPFTDTYGLTHSGTLSAEFKLGDFATPRFEEATSYLKHADKSEHVRLDYVAATRAQLVLAVPLEVPSTKNGYGDKRGKRFLYALDTMDDEFAPAPRETLPNWDRSAPAAKPTPVTADVAGAAASASEAHERARAAAAVAPRIAVTAIAHANVETVDEDNRSTEIIADAVQHTGARVRRWLGEQASASAAQRSVFPGALTLASHGAAFGSAVHEVMELLPSHPELSVEDLVRSIAPLHELDESAHADLSAAARSFAESEPYQRSLTDEAYRELPIICSLDGTAVDGVIDVLYRDGETWVIADYKTDRAATQETLDAYFTQLDIYAQTVERTLGTPVGRLELIFLTPQVPTGQGA